MIILKWIYKILFYLLTSFHNLYLTISGVVDRFNDTFSWSRPTVKTGASYSETFLMEDVGNKLRKQSKLPKHLACVFNEPVVNLDCVVSIIRWCAAAGISCISLYDHEGVIVKNADFIQNKLAEAVPGIGEKSLIIYSSFTSKKMARAGTHEVNVYLLSHHDGQHSFAQIAKKIAAMSSLEVPSQDAIEGELRSHYPAEPELLLQFGHCPSHVTLGYPPWLLRLTEMLRVSSHDNISAKRIASALSKYQRCEQRFGK